MPDVLRPFRRADQWMKSLSRLKYTLVTTTLLVSVMVLVDTVLIGDIGEILDAGSAGIVFGWVVSVYILYPWTVGDGDWSFPTSWPDTEE
jgi:Na+-driven multidrug efflux pump